MDDSKWSVFDPRFFEQLTYPAGQILQAVKQNKGVRVGHSTVLSRQMHTFNPATPEEIMVLQDVDAGAVFYRRVKPGEIYHLDIFHECGLVDHRKAAHAVKEAVGAYKLHYSIGNLVYNINKQADIRPDWIDIQTGTGGGRITGSLNYGKKLSLRKAHENHVHIAAMMEDQHVACLFYIIAAVESVIQASGLEIRRNEKIVNIKGSGRDSADLSAYSDYSDSFLQERNFRGMSPAFKRHQQLQDCAELMEEFDSIQEIQELLSEIERSQSRKKVLQYLEDSGASQQALERLAGMGLAKFDKNKVKLTEYGKEYQQFLALNLADVDAHLKKTYRLFRPECKSPGRTKFSLEHHNDCMGKSCPLPVMLGDGTGEIAVAETVNAAARRSVAEGVNFSGIEGADIQQYNRRKKTRTEICMLLDVSASMAGQRIRAAKFLVRHLLLSTPDKICVITFQEKAARIQVPFTRDYSFVEKCLSDVVAFGSTPMAVGLKTCLAYLNETSVKQPLIILVTDGVPTVSVSTQDPYTESIEAAKEVKRLKYGFTCFGLKPYRDYLGRLAEAAGGNLYIFDELEKQALVTAAMNMVNQRRS